MAFEGMLAKLGPALVREATPHLLQLVSGLSERFKKDTRDIKKAMDDEMASVARAHAGLVTTLEDHSARFAALAEQVAVVDRRIELLHKLMETSARQMATDASQAAENQRSSQRLLVLSVLLSGLSLAAAAGLFFLRH